jgi:putative ABC transport system permease protein
MFKTYVTIAARVLSRNKLYTTINVLGLSLGICGCVIIWLVGRYELSFDRFHPHGDRVYRVGGAGKPGERKDAEVLPPAPDAIRRRIPGLEDVTAFFPLYQGRKVSIPVSGKPAVQFDATPEGQDMPGAAVFRTSVTGSGDRQRGDLPGFAACLRGRCCQGLEREY